jgi:hypothetical protein
VYVCVFQNVFVCVCVCVCVCVSFKMCLRELSKMVIQQQSKQLFSELIVHTAIEVPVGLGVSTVKTNWDRDRYFSLCQDQLFRNAENFLNVETNFLKLSRPRLSMKTMFKNWDLAFETVSIKSGKLRHTFLNCFLNDNF